MAIATLIVAGVGVAVAAVGMVFAIINHSDLKKIKEKLAIDPAG